MDFTTLQKTLSKNIAHSKIEIIGESVLKRPIYAVRFDFGDKNTVIIQGAIHAREHITASLIVKQIFETSQNFEKYKALKVPNIVFVPMVNPDGVELAVNGIKSVKNRKTRKFLLEINGKSKDFSLFKANVNGVDLNTNFDAKWGSGKENLFFPSTHGFVGKSPMSEPCTKALALLTIKTKPIFTISYHCKGEELYYDFYNKKENLCRDKKIAKILARSLRYKIKSTQNDSSGGYKDWCILKFHIPAVTIEVGNDKLCHPILDTELEKIYKRNKNVIKFLSKISKEYDNAKSVYGKSVKACEKSI